VELVATTDSARYLEAVLDEEACKLILWLFLLLPGLLDYDLNVQCLFVGTFGRCDTFNNISLEDVPEYLAPDSSRRSSR
jgi:hypothetical protein